MRGRSFPQANSNPEVKAVVLTGKGKYYCAGVDLAATIRPMMPKKLHEDIRGHNQSLFDHFLNMQKPILVALNGPAVGASVTSATLCDGVVAVKHASLTYVRLPHPQHKAALPFFVFIFCCGAGCNFLAGTL